MNELVFWLQVYGVIWSSGLRVDIGTALETSFFAASVKSCWDSNERCLINGQLFRNESWGQIDLPIEIDCQPPFESLKRTEPYVLHRFEHVHNVTLNGCRTQFNTETYGFEFLPICGKITKATIERFYGDTMRKIRCPNPIELEVLILQNNEISAFNADAFENLLALREIYFKQNSVRHINRTALENLPQVQLIHVEHEECLKIKEADFLKHTGIADLRMIGLKNFHSELLQHLPVSIRFILVADMQVDNRELKVRNPFGLKNISVINCNLDSFILDDSYASVTFLNLSKNSLTRFSYETNQSHCVLHSLDLSGNKLKYFNTEWLRSLQCLQVLLLQENDLKDISMHELLLAVPSTSYIDLRDNQLEILGDIDADFLIDCDLVRVSVDRNPWNCLWLLNFTQTHPEKFRIFQYRKFISQINVNGLECRTSPELIDTVEVGTTRVTITEEKENHHSTIMNVSTYNLIYGNNREAKRNQRSEALIIVFMLPLGIALLFLLLYMWIYCQKLFHLSYYRTVPIIGKTIPPGPNDVGDLASQLPSNTKNEYEMPLNSAASICNCNHIGLDSNGSEEQCKKTHSHHITYEGAPYEKPYKLYEEIMADEHHAEVAQTHPFYDHLTYVEGYQTHMPAN